MSGPDVPASSGDELVRELRLAAETGIDGDGIFRWKRPLPELLRSAAAALAARPQQEAGDGERTAARRDAMWCAALVGALPIDQASDVLTLFKRVLSGEVPIPDGWPDLPAARPPAPVPVDCLTGCHDGCPHDDDEPAPVPEPGALVRLPDGSVAELIEGVTYCGTLGWAHPEGVPEVRDGCGQPQHDGPCAPAPVPDDEGPTRCRECGGSRGVLVHRPGCDGGDCHPFDPVPLHTCEHGVAGGFGCYDCGEVVPTTAPSAPAPPVGAESPEVPS